MDKEKYTPMMQHYLHLKEENPDAILMYRLGDFYEMFFDDAKTASRELDLVLTGRAAGAEKAPMCGIPFHAAEGYITRLVKKGYKVAVCEQLSDPKASKGLVERGIIKIVTPGTILESSANVRSENYLAVLNNDGWRSCLLLCDISTGELLYDIRDKSLSETVKLLSSFNIQEVVSSRTLEKTWQNALSQSEGFVFSLQKKGELSRADESLIPLHDEILIEAFEILMGYLQKTQMQHPDHLKHARALFPPAAMILDPETRNHLELTRSSSSSLKAQSLWEFMDHCQSSLGSRLLKSWIEAPLLDRAEIEKRQDALQTLLDQFLLRDQLRDHLSYVYDLERLGARVSYRSASPRDILQIASSLEHARPILEMSSALSSFPQLTQTDPCTDLYEEIGSAIIPDPPLTLKDGNVIAPGYSQELDELRRLADQGSSALLELEAREKERTGIKALKIGYNRVFGYYIEVRNGSLNQIQPEFQYIPRQTLANATRFYTEELKELEEKILNAQDRKIALEQELFASIQNKIKDRLEDLHQLAGSLALIDVLCALAELAGKQGYTRPVFSDNHCVEITEGRHPILEKRMSGFVSNNWQMSSNTSIQLITGPNMGGKSTWLRQNALIVIMAQLGSFVPARKAILPVFNRIFTRIGASDDLLQGKSTFMMEMIEANNALKFADADSLILFDEIGRGTATFDGMALAQAMLEYIDSVLHAKTLFSTHYHELTTLQESHPSIENVHVDVQENKKTIDFRYRVVPGKADKSYGINVARLAGLPGPVLQRADELLSQFENQNPQNAVQPGLFVMDPSDLKRNRLIEQLQDLDPDALSAREALDCLYRIHEQARKLDE